MNVLNPIYWLGMIMTVLFLPLAMDLGTVVAQVIETHFGVSLPLGAIISAIYLIAMVTITWIQAAKFEEVMSKHEVGSDHE